MIIPTAFYNFKQEVSSAAVSWDGSDASQAAELCKKESSLKVDELMQKMPILSAISSLGEYSIIESDVGTLHRHPGRFGFSATDYDMNPESPGVIFRKRGSQEFIQNDCVMYFSGNTEEIYCSETRISNTKEVDGGVEGCYEEAETHCMVYQDTVEEKPSFQDLLGGIDTSIYSKYKILSNRKVDSFYAYPIVEKILKDYDAIDYAPDTTNVIGSRITQMYTQTRYVGGYGRNVSYRAGRYCSIEKRFLTTEEWDEREKQVAVKENPPSYTTPQSELVIEDNESELSEEDIYWDEYEKSMGRRLTEEELIQDYFNNGGMIH